jgi:hypothetical protein
LPSGAVTVIGYVGDGSYSVASKPIFASSLMGSVSPKADGVHWMETRLVDRLARAFVDAGQLVQPGFNGPDTGRAMHGRHHKVRLHHVAFDLVRGCEQPFMVKALAQRGLVGHP